MVPSYITAFNGPNSELILTEEATLLGSSLTGVVRWRAPLTSFPSTFDGLVALGNRVRVFELSMLEQSDLRDALVEITTTANRRPQLRTDLFDTTDEAVRAAQTLAGLELDPLVLRLAEELSMGERQRVAVARAVSCSPTVLVADEPTAHQGERRADLVMAAMRAVADAGGGVLVATARRASADEGPPGGAMVDGRIVGSGHGP